MIELELTSNCIAIMVDGGDVGKELNVHVILFLQFLIPLIRSLLNPSLKVIANKCVNL